MVNEFKRGDPPIFPDDSSVVLPVSAHKLWFPGGTGSTWTYKLNTGEEEVALVGENKNIDGLVYKNIQGLKTLFGNNSTDSTVSTFLTFRTNHKGQIVGYAKEANQDFESYRIRFADREGFFRDDVVMKFQSYLLPLGLDMVADECNEWLLLPKEVWWPKWGGGQQWLVIRALIYAGGWHFDGSEETIEIVGCVDPYRRAMKTSEREVETYLVSYSVISRLVVNKVQSRPEEKATFCFFALRPNIGFVFSGAGGTVSNDGSLQEGRVNAILSEYQIMPSSSFQISSQGRVAVAWGGIKTN